MATAHVRGDSRKRAFLLEMLLGLRYRGLGWALPPLSDNWILHDNKLVAGYYCCYRLLLGGGSTQNLGFRASGFRVYAFTSKAQLAPDTESQNAMLRSHDPSQRSYRRPKLTLLKMCPSSIPASLMQFVRYSQ